MSESRSNLEEMDESLQRGLEIVVVVVVPRTGRENAVARETLKGWTSSQRVRWWVMCITRDAIGVWTGVKASTNMDEKKSGCQVHRRIESHSNRHFDWPVFPETGK